LSIHSCNSREKNQVTNHKDDGNNTSSQEITPEIAIEHAMQWILDDLFNNRVPRPEDWSLIPPGNATEAFEALKDAASGGTPKLKNTFNALTKMETHQWLKPLKSKAIPSRDTTEGEPIIPPKHHGILLSDVSPKEVRWLWPGRLPLGKLVMLDGDPGLGKTTVMFDIAAKITKGASMPDGIGPSIKGGVVLICLEDGLEDTIQPRLAKAGADLSKIVSIGFIKDVDKNGVEYERPFNLATDLPLLEDEIKRVDAKLIIIDPIMAILGGKDTYKDNEVRSTLSPLKALVEKSDVCSVMIRHVTKSGGDKLIYQGGGSIAFIGLARVGLMVLTNPNDEEQVILANPKNNLSKMAPKLLYRVVSEEEDERPHIQWEGITTITDRELTGNTQDAQGETRKDILKYLRSCYPDQKTYQQVAEEVEEEESVVKNLLSRMVKANQIERAARNIYTALSGLS
jgi:AAA domain